MKKKGESSSPLDLYYRKCQKFFKLKLMGTIKMETYETVKYTGKGKCIVKFRALNHFTPV